MSHGIILLALVLSAGFLYIFHEYIAIKHYNCPLALADLLQ